MIKTTEPSPRLSWLFRAACVALANASLVLCAAVSDAVAQSPPLIPQLPQRPSTSTSGAAAPSAPATTAGRTPGSFAVSNSGAATYSIPIWAPPGPQGLQPTISLYYSSHGTNGPMGVGWGMGGLSSIYRCNQTFAQDSAPAGVTLTYSDRFCMDGKRLRLSSSDNLSTYGQDSTTYQTEVADFSNITAHSAAGNGPSYFTVQGRNGWTYEYGNSTDSRVLANGSTASAWMLDKVTDRAGNTMIFAYKLADANLKGMTLPASISWTPTSHGASSYNYTMQFTYQSLALAPKAGYLAGQPVQNFYSLTNIQVQSLGTTVKNYVLSYAASSTTGRQTLTAITECADAGATNCLTPTQVTYQSGQAGVGNAVTLANSYDSGGGLYTAYDFNADGINDLAWYNASSGTWWVAFGTSTGYAAPINTGLTFIGYNAVIDSVDGSGIDEFLFPVNGTLYYYKWNGSSFVGTSTHTTIAVTQQNSYALADLNGDGLPDLISTGSDGYLYVQLNTTTSGSVSFSTPIRTVTNQCTAIDSGLSGSRRLDFSGSGQQDVLCYIHTNFDVYAMHFNGTTFTYNFIGSSRTVVDMADYNDDGCTDVLENTALVISACNGSPAASLALTGTVVAGIDWDGDGREDILVVNGNTLSVYKSTGTGFSSTAISTTIPYSAGSGSAYINAHNATGAGLDALVVLPLAAPNTIQYYRHNGAGQPPDLLSSVTDGFAMQVSFTYTPLPSGVAYSADIDSAHAGPDPTYPHSGGATLDPIYIGPLYVASQLSASDGTGGTYTNSFWYYGARMNHQGRGFDGFYAKRTLDSRKPTPSSPNGLYTYGYVRRDFPYIGMTWETDAYQPNNSTLMRQVTNSFATKTLDGTTYNTRSFPYVSSSVENSYEAGGSADRSWITQKTATYATPDLYGNFPSITVATTDKDSGSPFVGQTFTQILTQHFSYGSPASDWCVHIPDTVSVQSTLPDGTSLTRHYGSQGQGVDYGACRVTDEYIEAGSSTLAVTTHYVFDSCGNPQSVTVTGRKPDGTAMTPRTTGYNFGSRCQLPESITNALNQTTNIVYTYNFGVRTKVTDPNGIATNWTYDAFGRMQTETRPDNTSSTYTYYSCNTPPCWGVNDLRFSVYRDDYGTDGTLANAEGFYWDGLNRLRYDQTVHAFGTLVYEKIDGYDSLGRTIWRYQPVSSGTNGYTAFSYDLLNRPTTANLYQSSGALDRTTSWAYAGRTTTITDPRNYNTTKVIDVMGRLRQTTDPSPGGTTHYDFDTFGNLNKTTDPINAVSTATYNLRGFKTQMVNADRGTWTYNGDSLNELVSWTDAKPQSFGAAYDALGRMTSRTEPEGTSTWTWGNTASAHNIGSLQAESGYGYAESLSYDGIGRLQTRVISSDQSYQYDYAYNSIGAIATITYPTSPAPTGTTATRYKIQYGYSYGFPIQISDITQPTAATLWTLTAANDYSSPTTETLGASAVSVQSGYKAWTDELTSMQSGVAGSTTNRQNLTYAWDLNGNLHERQDLNQNLAEIFTYDALNRFTSSTLNGTQNFSASYVNGSGVDQAGNIMSRSDVGSYTYGDVQHPHAVTAAGSYSFTYDKNGNAATRNNINLTWASFKLPTFLSATVGGSTYTSTFSYGPDHQRYHQSATYSNGTENTSYAGGLLQMVWGTDTAGVNLYRHYVPTPSGRTIVVSRNSDGSTTTTYALSDHLGSSDAVVDGTAGRVGNLLVQESFGAFGQRRGSTWTGMPSTGDYAAIAKATRGGFTFHEELDNIGLVHMNGRVYDPNVGRFLSADPIGENPQSSQSWNRYSYVNNNPLTFVDPSGFDPLAGCQIGDTALCNETPSGLPPDVLQAQGLFQQEIIVQGTPPAQGVLDLNTLWGMQSAGVGGPPSPSTGTAGQAETPPMQTVTVTAPAWHPPMPLPPTIPIVPFWATFWDSVGGGVGQPLCTKYPRQAAFVNANLSDASQIATRLNTPVGNVLGLAGYESNWGGGQLIAAGTNNYFSLKAGPAFATGAIGTYRYGPNTFWTYPGPGMLASGNALSQSYFGARVYGTTSPQDFSAALNAGGKYNSDPNYNATLVSTINQANAVKGCP